MVHRRTTRHYTKHWLAQTDILGQERNTLATSTAYSSVTGDLVQDFATKVTVRSAVLRRATSHEFAPLPIQACQTFATSRNADGRPRIRPYNPYRRTVPNQILKVSKNALPTFPATAIIPIWSFCFCRLCWFTQLAICQAQLFDTAYYELFQTLMRCYTLQLRTRDDSRIRGRFLL